MTYDLILSIQIISIKYLLFNTVAIVFKIHFNSLKTMLQTAIVEKVLPQDYNFSGLNGQELFFINFI